MSYLRNNFIYNAEWSIDLFANTTMRTRKPIYVVHAGLANDKTVQ